MPRKTDDEITPAPDDDEITPAPDEGNRESDPVNNPEIYQDQAADDEGNFASEEQNNLDEQNNLIEEIKLYSKEKSNNNKLFNIQNFVLQNVPTPIISFSAYISAISTLISLATLLCIEKVSDEISYKTTPQNSNSTNSKNINDPNSNTPDHIKAAAFIIIASSLISTVFCFALKDKISKKQRDKDKHEELINSDSLYGFITHFDLLTTGYFSQEQKFNTLSEFLKKYLEKLENTEPQNPRYIPLKDRLGHQITMFRLTKSVMLRMNPDIFIESFDKLNSYFNPDQKKEILKEFLKKQQDNKAEESRNDLAEPSSITRNFSRRTLSKRGLDTDLQSTP
jgi:hypothetical protein